jgi:dCMP deaminase
MKKVRITKTALYLGIAHLMSQRSTCNRGQVGVIAVIEGRVIASGYNGSIKDMPHCDDSNCNEDTPCVNTVHAEANLVSYAAKYGISLNNSSIYCTTSPCKRCAELLIQSGVKAVYYTGTYRDDSGLKLLEECGVHVERVIIEKPFNPELELKASGLDIKQIPCECAH